jgi:hypothetical protein
VTDNRQTRLNNLKSAVKEYATAERTRLQNEVKILNDIIAGRGANVSDQAVNYAAGVAQKSLTDYLSEA